MHSNNSKGTAFILTHEADTSTEASKETELRANLGEGEELHKIPPICVIAKERLESEAHNAIADGLRTAIKRAGLRRGIHEVLIKAESEVVGAFRGAMDSLLTIPPEQLDEYVVNRAVAEGVSELHVIERALTATMSESIRRMFATDPHAIQSATRLRKLQAVSLPLPQAPHSDLEEFRRKELWEPGELVNGGFAALACGDVFDFAADEGVNDPRRFILLVQPCDVMLRPNGRDAESGFLVPLKVRNTSGDDKNKIKSPTLPFLLDALEWSCDFRNATSVRLHTLDLATLRADGKVRFDKGQKLPITILPGQEKSGKKLLAKMEQALQARANQKGADKNLVDTRCTLTLAATGPFKEIAQPAYVPVPSNGASGKSAQNRKGQQKSAAKPDHSADLRATVETEQSVAGVATQGANEVAATEAANNEQYGPVATHSTGSSQVAFAESARSETASLVLPAHSVAQTDQQGSAGTDLAGVGVIEESEMPTQGVTEPVAEKIIETVPHFTWRIRRCGRVRMPYAASILNSYLSLMGREAFDLDYLKAIPEVCDVDCSSEPADVEAQAAG